MGLVSRRESRALREMTKVATPLTMTMAMASACPFMFQRSRSSFRRRAFTGSPPHLPRGLLPLVPCYRVDDPRADPDHAVRHLRDVGVVGDQRHGGPELPVDPLQR